MAEVYKYISCFGTHVCRDDVFSNAEVRNAGAAPLVKAAKAAQKKKGGGR